MNFTEAQLRLVNAISEDAIIDLLDRSIQAYKMNQTKQNRELIHMHNAMLLTKTVILGKGSDLNKAIREAEADMTILKRMRGDEGKN